MDRRVSESVRIQQEPSTCLHHVCDGMEARGVAHYVVASLMYRF